MLDDSLLLSAVLFGCWMGVSHWLLEYYHSNSRIGEFVIAYCVPLNSTYYYYLLSTILCKAARVCIFYLFGYQ